MESRLHPVENFSFESPDLGHDTAIAEEFTVVAPPGWTAVANSVGNSSTAVGVVDPIPWMYTNTNGPVLQALRMARSSAT